MPDRVPAPPPTLLDQLPEPRVAAAVATLAGLIARAAHPPAGAEPAEEAGDE
jgi:hypothetical protein